jgi:cellulose synthase/poly-beta-1,6-N-acetylglucosamine synthase-like glycosyltransferase
LVYGSSKVKETMAGLLEFVFLLLFALFVGIYGVYFTFIRLWTKKKWGLAIDKNFRPKVSVLIPVHDEEKVVLDKLKNVKSVAYPREHIEIIVTDDASDDNTLKEVEGFIVQNPDIKVEIVRQTVRRGKSAALNNALPSSTSDVIIVSDADTEWPEDMLQKTMPFLADSKIGAVTCGGTNTNKGQTWVTKGEETYLHFANAVRLGESKLHSTIRFEGGFCAFKRSAFDRFDSKTGADDSGTALDVVQRGYRAIMVPDVLFYTIFPTLLSSKLKTKARRATQLMSLWVKCFKLLLQRKLVLPKKIAVPEILLFILSPIILVALIVTAIAAVVLSPLSIFSIIILIIAGGLLIFARRVFVEGLIDNLVLFYALISLVGGRHYQAWEKPQS